MVIDRGWGYCTSYKFKNKTFYNEVCYAGVRSKLGVNYYSYEEYSFCLALPKVVKKGSYTFLSKEDTFKFCAEVFRLLGCKFLTFSESDEYYWAQILIPGDSRFILFVSTIVRYAFEEQFAHLTYFAYHNKYLREKLDLIHCIQLYISYFKVNDNHSLLVRDYTVRNFSVKSWFNNYRNYFTTNGKDTLYLKGKYDSLDHRYIDPKCFPILQYYYDDIINKVFKKHEKDLYCRRS